MSKELVSEYDDRLRKLQEIIDSGVDPYPSKAHKTNLIAEVLSDFEKLAAGNTALSLCGRVISKRSHGNLSFVGLRDESGDFQLAVSRDEIGKDNYKFFQKKIDLGDFIEVNGTAFVTQKGEQSLKVANFKLLSKALRPLPDKFHGLKDEDERLRKRYLDLLLNKEAREEFKLKARFWDVTRNFMKDKGFLEVETPTLELTTGGAEANPFKTHHDDFDIDVFLRISVGELWQKRLMAAGFEKTFEIGRVYRNEGTSPEHLQEFTNMEFYWAYANYEDGMKLTQELYQCIADEVFGTTKFEARGHKFDLAGDWPRVDYQEEIKKQTGIDVVSATETEMKAKLEELEVKYEGDNKERLTDTLWKYCRKNIAGPAFLVNHPKLISPLAKESVDRPGLTERFQILIAGAEVGNGYSELNNPVDQRERFEEQRKLLEAGDNEAMMPDEEFVEMLEYGMPPTCGFGFGERLFAFLVNKPVRETSMFPLVKPKNSEQKTVNRKQDEDGDLGIDYSDALKLVDEHVTDEITRLHSLETEYIMRALARHFGQDEEPSVAKAMEDRWGIIGLLHDIDWDYTKEDVKNHTVKAVNILKEAGATDFLIESIVSHAYGNNECGEHPDKERDSLLQHCLVSAETATGLIMAAALVQPDKKLASVKLSSLKKKFKQKSFAANCDRELIKEIEKTGLELGEFLEIALKALQDKADKLKM